MTEQQIIEAFIKLVTDPKIQAEVLHAVEGAAQTALEIAAHARRPGGLWTLPQQIAADEIKKKYGAEFHRILGAAAAGQMTEESRSDSIREAMERYLAELKGLPS